MTTNQNTTISKGTTVTLHYTGTLEDGTTFDSSHERGEPITVTLGEGTLLPAFEENLLGLAEGAETSFTLVAQDAYGERHDDHQTTLAKTLFPPDFEFETDMIIPLQGPHGPVMSTLLESTETEVTVDLNHPMAGKDLTFAVEILSLSDTTDE